MEGKQLKSKEQRAFWVGIGTVLAVLCLIIGFASLIFGGSETQEGKKPAKEEVASEKEKKDTSKDDEKASQEKKEEVSGTEEEGSVSGEEYEVQPGDTLFQIGLKYNMDWRTIQEANDLSADAVLTPGETLIIPQE